MTYFKHSKICPPLYEPLKFVADGYVFERDYGIDLATCQGRQRGWCGGTPSLALAVVSLVQSRPPETAPHMDGASGSVTRTPL